MIVSVVGSCYSWYCSKLGTLSEWIPNHCLQGKCRVRLLWVFGYKVMSTNQHTLLFYVCFCLQTLYLVYITDSLTLNSKEQICKSCCGWYLVNTHIFSVRHVRAFLNFGNSTQHFSMHSGAILNRETEKSPAKDTKVWKRGSNKWPKDTCLHFELKQEGRLPPSLTGDCIKLAVCMSGNKPLPPFCTYLWMMATTSQALILWLKINFSKEANLQ